MSCGCVSTRINLCPIPIDGKIAFPCDNNKERKDASEGRRKERKRYLLLEVSGTENCRRSRCRRRHRHRHHRHHHRCRRRCLSLRRREDVTGSDIAVGYASTQIPRALRCVVPLCDARVMVPLLYTCNHHRAVSSTGTIPLLGSANASVHRSTPSMAEVESRKQPSGRSGALRMYGAATGMSESESGARSVRVWRSSEWVESLDLAGYPGFESVSVPPASLGVGERGYAPASWSCRSLLSLRGLSFRKTTQQRQRGTDTRYHVVDFASFRGQ